MTKKEKILRLIEVSGMLKQTKQLMELQLEALKIEDAEIYDAITQHDLFDRLVNEDIKNIVIEIYEKYFNENQIKKLIEVYEDPNMQKLIEDAPKIYQEITQKMESSIEKLIEDLDLPDY